MSTIRQDCMFDMQKLFEMEPTHRFNAIFSTLELDSRPKECESCSLKDDSMCQKVYKIQRPLELRKYTSITRGSLKWVLYYKQRAAVE